MFTYRQVTCPLLAWLRVCVCVFESVCVCLSGVVGLCFVTLLHLHHLCLLIYLSICRSLTSTPSSAQLLIYSTAEHPSSDRISPHTGLQNEISDVVPVLETPRRGNPISGQMMCRYSEPVSKAHPWSSYHLTSGGAVCARPLMALLR